MITINAALHAKALYLQAGREGDRLKHDLNRPKVLVEIPETGFHKIWKAILEKHYKQHFRKKGLNRAESRRATTGVIEELDKFGNLRMTSS